MGVSYAIRLASPIAYYKREIYTSSSGSSLREKTLYKQSNSGINIYILLYPLALIAPYTFISIILGILNKQINLYLEKEIYKNLSAKELKIKIDSTKDFLDKTRTISYICIEERPFDLIPNIFPFGSTKGLKRTIFNTRNTLDKLLDKLEVTYFIKKTSK